jgi:hypothetical protein
MTDKEKLKTAKHILGVMETGTRNWKKDKNHKREWGRSRDLADIVSRINKHIEDFSKGGDTFTLYGFEMALMQWGDDLFEFLHSVDSIRPPEQYSLL